MSTTRVKPPQKTEGGGEPASTDIFTFQTKRGDTIVCGKPKGVLKLKLRNILTLEEIEEDLEMVQMVKAMIAIQTINGEKPKLGNRMAFETILQNTFGDDEDLDTFMAEFQRLLDPDYAEFIETTLKQALEEGLVEPDEIKKYMTKKLLERQNANAETVRL